MKYMITIALAACVLVSLNSCTKCDRFGQAALERSIEKGIESATGGQVDVGMGRAVRLPAGFPRELIPPGGKAIAKWSVHNKDEGGDFVTFESSISLDRAISYYENLSGWTAEGNVETSNGTILTLKSGNETGVITIGEAERKTTIAVIYSKQ